MSNSPPTTTANRRYREEEPPHDWAWARYPLIEDEPSRQRWRELEDAREANETANLPPYEGVHIKTKGELLKIIEERGWQTPGTLYGHPKNTSDLRGANFFLANLSGIQLGNADLRGAKLTSSNLADAVLINAKLSKAEMVQVYAPGIQITFANLGGLHALDGWFPEADFTRAVFDGDAVLFRVNLKGAVLQDIDLRGVTLTGASLQGADLRMCRMDEVTTLDGATIDERTKVGNVVWGGTNLVRINWGEVGKLGDELEIALAEGRERKVKAYRECAEAYLLLSNALRAQGVARHASRYRRRQKNIERQAEWAERRVGRAIGYWSLDLIAGYGESVLRALLAYVAVVLVWAGMFWQLSQRLEPRGKRFGFDQALLLSISSFHGRGFFPSSLTITLAMDWLAASEAVIGLFVEAILVATFVRRFLGD